MKSRYIIGLAACVLALSACQGQTYKEDEQDFKPYILNQQDTIPGVYPKDAWIYPAGTPTREIVTRWKNAGLIQNAYSNKDNVLEITAGPQFYSLPQSSQQGLADAVAKMYGGRQFRLMDWKTKRVIGTYTAEGLQMY